MKYRVELTGVGYLNASAYVEADNEAIAMEMAILQAHAGNVAWRHQSSKDECVEAVLVTRA